MTTEATETMSVDKAYSRLKARSRDSLVVVEGDNCVRLIHAESIAALNIWRCQHHKVAGVFNANTSLIDLRASVRQVAHEIGSVAA